MNSNKTELSPSYGHPACPAGRPSLLKRGEETIGLRGELAKSEFSLSHLPLFDCKPLCLSKNFYLGKLTFMNLRSSITKLTFLFVLLFISTATFSQDNYVRVETFRVPVTDANTIPALNHPDKVTAFSYVDGLGRSLQSVAAKAGPNQEDVVSFSTYDLTTGKQLESYLPYTIPSATPGAFRPSFATEQTSFYNQGGDLASDTKPYSLSEFENSPLNRVKSVIAPGADYHTNDKKTIYSYAFYVGGTDIVHWKLDGAGLPVRGAVYGGNSLRITQMLTPDQRKAQTIVDGRGLNIASRKWDGTAWNTTYNVYDEMGRLRYIIPPTMANELTLSTKQIEGNLFEYKYDSRGRVIESRSPGAGWTYAVYDKWSRLVMTRHDGQKDGTNDSWTFFKYDNFNRQIISGVVTVTLGETRSSLQTAANTSVLARYEGTANDATGYTTGASFPKLGSGGYGTFEPHTINYFDNYDFKSNVGWDAENLDLRSFQPEGFNIPALPRAGYTLLESNHTVTTGEANDKLVYGQGTTVTIPAGVTLTPGSHIVAADHHSSLVNGMPTGSKVLILGSNDKWLNSVQYYDNRLRPIQTVAENHLGGIDRITSEVNYTTGEVIKTLVEHTGSESVNLLTEYTYDHVGRLLQTHETVGNAPRTLVGDYKYNMLGELVEKNIHSTDGGTSFLQSVDYRYNIRKQLTSINDAQLTQGTEANRDIFGLELNYTSGATVNGQTVPGSYDGNIAAISWNSDNDPTTVGIQGGSESIYGYTYDKLNQLSAANYATWDAANTDWSDNGGNFDMTASYDENGNRNTLTRNADGTPIDNLGYDYVNNNGTPGNLADDYTTNKLLKVTDTGTGEGFDNYNANTGSSTDYSGEYAYDDMGNMIFDGHKEISLSYNHLQLVDKIEFMNGSNVLSAMNYTYDAAGNRLSKAVVDAGGNTIAKVDYVGLVGYLDGEINQVLIEGGRAYKQNGTYHNEYFIGDHQGNNRVAFGNLPDRTIYSASMETENSSGEESEFDFPSGIRSTVENHTPLMDESVALNGTVSGKQVGPAKVLNIAAGDEVDMEVWAKYNFTSWDNSSIANIASLVSSAFGGASVGTGAESASGSLSNALGNPGANGLFANGQSQEPNAYLQYMFFDTNHNFVPAGSGFVSVGAGAEGSFAKLSSGTQMYSQAGYLFVYLVNESNQNADVYFDDIKIVHASATASFKVSQVNEYYPYGLPTSNSWRDPGYVDPGLLYQAAFASYDSLTGYYDFQFRNYDPALGQFFAVDPLAAVTSGYSPYHANYNNPVMFTDPLGLMPGGDPDRRYYDERDDYIDYEPTFYMGPALTWGEWGRNNGVYSGNHWTSRQGIGSSYTYCGECRSSGSGSSASYDITVDFNAVADGSNSTFNFSGGELSGWSLLSGYGPNGYSSAVSYGTGINNYTPIRIGSNKGTIFTAYRDEGSTGGGGLGIAKEIALYGGIQAGFIWDQSVDIALREGRRRYEGPKEMLKRKAGLKSISKVTKGLSGAFTAVGVVASFAEFANSDQSGADYARLVGAGVIIGTNFIPYVGPLVSTSLAVGDATGQFDGFYNGFDHKQNRNLFFNLLISGGHSAKGPFKP
ncbi:MAG: DUF6443 domain-containing protein [Cyclobacteriaceae bacterium]